jgi:hypothetical protein
MLLNRIGAAKPFGESPLTIAVRGPFAASPPKSRPMMCGRAEGQ